MRQQEGKIGANQVDRDGPLPIYHQVAMNIEQRIAAGDWQIGERLPSERDLAETYGTSRMTMRQALAVLERDGIVIRRRPGGTFVSLRPEKLAPTMSIPVSFVQTLIMSGRNSSLETLSTMHKPVPSAEIARQLGIRRDGMVTQIDRLIRVEGTPTARVCSLVPAALCPGLYEMPLVADSIHVTMRQHFGIMVVAADHWIETGSASPGIARDLDLEHGSNVLVLVSRYCNEAALPVEYVTTHWRADVVKLHLRSQIGEEGIGH
ncbi:MAG: GntR family transcriptional regulator [Thermomicrobiales bacterium]